MKAALTTAFCMSKGEAHRKVVNRKWQFGGPIAGYATDLKRLLKASGQKDPRWILIEQSAAELSAEYAKLVRTSGKMSTLEECAVYVCNLQSAEVT